MHNYSFGSIKALELKGILSMLKKGITSIVGLSSQHEIHWYPFRPYAHTGMGRLDDDDDLYTWVERGTLRVKCLAQEHNHVPGQGSNPDCSVRRQVH